MARVAPLPTAEAARMVAGYVDEQLSIKTLSRRFHRDQASVSKAIRAAGVHGTLLGRVNRARRGGSYDVIVARQSGLPVQPTPLQWAYIAGIFDGEGSLEIHRLGRCRVSIAQKDHALHRYLLRILGTGSVQQNDHCAQWRLTGQRKVFEFLRGVVPHLVVKRTKTEDAIALLRGRYASLRSLQ